MIPTDTFVVSAAQREPEPRITLARRDTGGTIAVDAAALIAQFALPQGDVLLILDEDSSYEEQLHLLLIRDVRTLDHLVIGAPYASGIYREAESGGETLRFRFEGDAIWTVTWNAAGTRGLFDLPSGARRRGNWRAQRHLFLLREDARWRSRVTP